MAGAYVTIDDRALVAALQRLQQHVSDLTPVYRDIGEQIQNQTKQRFRDQVDPDGIPWRDYAPLDDEYRAHKKKNADKILIYDGYLSRGIHYQPTEQDVEIGTNEKYGATHQFGREEDGIPARPFLGLSDEDEAEVLEIIEQHIRDAI